MNYRMEHTPDETFEQSAGGQYLKYPAPLPAAMAEIWRRILPIGFQHPVINTQKHQKWSGTQTVTRARLTIEAKYGSPLLRNNVLS
ncbi:hypothetical protein [Paenibacillus sp. FSL L8-0463]|uniref:hypothetical protein n=1 Tax=Paenibacillus sp. FSL L8-0463 TaxID=2954687 RepID=UPI0040547B8A